MASSNRRLEHIALVGDSILDNKAYTGSGPCVTEHLEFKLHSRNWTVTNCAVDGDVVDDVVEDQMRTIPNSATAIVLSAGGNDGLGLLHELLAEGVTFFNLIAKLRDIQSAFKGRYARMLDALDHLGLPLIVCTVYHPQFERDEVLTRIAAGIGVPFLNYVIRSEARQRGLPVIDLARIFNRPEDYANAIEPSAWGGDKISNNIIKVLEEHDFSARRSAQYWCRSYSASPTPGMVDGDRRDASRLAKAAKNERFRAPGQLLPV